MGSKILLVIGLIMVLFFGFTTFWGEYEKASLQDGVIDTGFAQDFLNYGLTTNTDKYSIDKKLILDGGPGKDGIPAINKPEFITADQQVTQQGLKNDTLGIAVSFGGESRFYPYSILYWHEIVNDQIGDTKFSVTFCPLCGTAIVYDRVVDGEERLFGVSGKLYESNLLMYDNKNESLWSQSLGESLVGDDLGKKLDLLPSDLMEYNQFITKFPEGKILSEQTGFYRNYDRKPYGSYENDDSLYFPVRHKDTRLDKKELIFVLPYNGESYAFVRQDLIKLGALEYSIGEEKILISYDDGNIVAKKGDTILPGYIEMWFSWATGHPESENVWIYEG